MPGWCCFFGSKSQPVAVARQIQGDCLREHDVGKDGVAYLSWILVSVVLPLSEKLETETENSAAEKSQLDYSRSIARWLSDQPTGLDEVCILDFKLLAEQKAGTSAKYCACLEEVLELVSCCLNVLFGTGEKNGVQQVIPEEGEQALSRFRDLMKILRMKTESASEYELALQKLGVTDVAGVMKQCSVAAASRQGETAGHRNTAL